jgi:hypothetical protein
VETKFENLYPKLNSAKTELRSNAETRVREKVIDVNKLQQTLQNRWQKKLYLYVGYLKQTGFSLTVIHANVRGEPPAGLKE